MLPAVLIPGFQSEVCIFINSAVSSCAKELITRQYIHCYTIPMLIGDLLRVDIMGPIVGVCKYSSASLYAKLLV